MIAQQCGQVLIDTANEIGDYFPKQGFVLPYVQIATFNDYEEGTEVETGIDNCYSISNISVNQSTDTLNWTLSSSDSHANVDTINNYNLWWADPNDPQQHLTLVTNSISRTATSLNLLPYFPITQTTHVVNLYLEMVGMPLITNKMSQAVSYTY